MTNTELIDALESHYGERFRRTSDTRAMVEIDTGERRSQVVYVLTHEVNREDRDFSRLVVETSIGPVPRRGADYESLLRRNADLPVGAIGIADLRIDDGTVVAYYVLRATHQLSTLSFEDAWDLIEHVARDADRLERDIFGSDLH